MITDAQMETHLCNMRSVVSYMAERVDLADEAFAEYRKTGDRVQLGMAMGHAHAVIQLAKDMSTEKARA